METRGISVKAEQDNKKHGSLDIFLFCIQGERRYVRNRLLVPEFYVNLVNKERGSAKKEEIQHGFQQISRIKIP